MNKFSKLIGALVGSASAPAIIQYLGMLGVHVPADLVTTALPFLVTVLSALGVYVAPKNAGTDQHVTVPVYVQPEPPASALAPQTPGTLEPPYPSAPHPGQPA